MKTIKKFGIILLVAVALFALGTKNAFAADKTPMTINGIIQGGQSFIASGDGTSIFNSSSVISGTSNVYNILLGVAIFVAFLIGMILGIKYITSGVEGQAKIKESLIPFAIGIVVVFGALTIWRITYKTLQNVESSVETSQVQTINRF